MPDPRDRRDPEPRRASAVGRPRPRRARRLRGRRLGLITAVALGLGVLSAVVPSAAVAAPGASAGARGAVLLDAEDTAGRQAVVAAGGSRLVDYGAFALWTVPAAGRARVAAASAAAGDTALTTIELRNRTLHTDAAVPAPGVLAAPASDARQLRLVQFVGPVRGEWLDRFAKAGATVVGYVPNNAYIVSVSGKGAAALDALVGTDPVVQYSGPFHPADRLAPDLLATVGKSGAALPATTDVTVQVVDGPDAAATVAAVSAFGPAVGAPSTVLGLRNLAVRVPTKELGTIAAMAAVVDVERYSAPVRNDEVQDQLLAGNVRTTGGKTVPTAPGYLAWLQDHGFPTTPASYPLVAVVDDGLDNGSATPLHPDFFSLGSTAGADRVSAVTNCTTDATARSQAGHGTLNAGIVGGYNNTATAAAEDADGYQYGLGVSPFGRLAGVKIFRDTGGFDVANCGGGFAGIVAAAYAQGATFTTNSWGASAGGAYTAASQLYDSLVRDASATTAGNQQMLQVFSAGNDGPGPSTLGAPGTAKNVLTVGATENVREQGTLDGCNISAADSDSDLAVFSSRGPTTDQRAKPDVVAAGTHVEGPASQGAGFDGTGVCGNPTGDDHHPVGSSLYTWSSGTSHSTPAVAGGASLAYQWYGREIAPGSTPSPAMLKALLVNQPRYLAGEGTGGTLPGTGQGWGVPDLGALFDPSLSWLTLDQSRLFTASGQSSTSVGTVADPARPTHVTLTFTDAPGSTAGDAAVNDLDLLVTAGGVTYRGNVLSGDTSVAGGTGDARNTVENVLLPAGLSGPVSIRVVARTVAGDAVPGNASSLDQDFALLASNVTAGATGVVENRDALVSDTTDADTVASPGEPLVVSVPVGNVGDAALPAGTGTLTVVSGPGKVVRGTTTYPAIAAGASAAGVTAYHLRVTAAAACGARIVVRHTYAAGGRTVVRDLPVTVGGPYSPSGTYTTRTATDVPKAVPDDTPAGVVSSLTVPDTGQDVGDVRVTVSVTHPYDEDLELTLRAPDGTAVLLVADRGNGGDDFANTVFDDAAATPVSAGSSPFTGTFRPEQPLAGLDGHAIGGVWTLTVVDDAAQDVGTLTAWSLAIDPLVPGVCAAVQPYLDVLDAGPVAEGSSATVQATLLNPGTGAVSVRLATVKGTAVGADFTSVTKTLRWTAGTAATQNVRIPITADAVSEPQETFGVRVQNPTVPATPTVATVVIAAN